MYQPCCTPRGYTPRHYAVDHSTKKRGSSDYSSNDWMSWFATKWAFIQSIIAARHWQDRLLYQHIDHDRQQGRQDRWVTEIRVVKASSWAQYILRYSSKLEWRQWWEEYVNRLTANVGSSPWRQMSVSFAPPSDKISCCWICFEMWHPFLQFSYVSRPSALLQKCDNNFRSFDATVKSHQWRLSLGRWNTMNVVVKGNTEVTNVDWRNRVGEEGCLPSGAMSGFGHCVPYYIIYGREHL